MSDENAIDNPLNLDIPDHLQYSEEHVWVDDSVSPAIVGITAYAEQAGDEVLELESAKAVEPLVCPVAGTIRYVNHDAADDPSVVNNDPYGEGWLLKIELDDDEPELLDAESYAKIAQ